MTKRFGFTLAEVLITLGIIGVVAAMTMPTLMNSTQGAQYKAAYKKALSALSQAITLNVALDEVDFGELNNTDDDYKLATILSKRMNVVRTTAGTGDLPTTEYDIVNKGGTDDAPMIENGAQNTTLFMNDGIMFQYKPAEAIACTRDETITGHTDCFGFIDVNGTKGPNKVVTCDASTGGGGGTPCKVTNPTDIYPVVFYDTSVLPATEAAKAVLYGK